MDDMKKYIPLRADPSDIKEAMRDVLREEKVLTKKDLANIPTIKEIEKTLELYPTKEDLANAFRQYATKIDLTNATASVLSEIKKMRLDMALALGLKSSKAALS